MSADPASTSSAVCTIEPTVTRRSWTSSGSSMPSRVDSSLRRSSMASSRSLTRRRIDAGTEDTCRYGTTSAAPSSPSAARAAAMASSRLVISDVATSSCAWSCRRCLSSGAVVPPAQLPIAPSPARVHPRSSTSIEQGDTPASCAAFSALHSCPRFPPPPGSTTGSTTRRESPDSDRPAARTFGTATPAERASRSSRPSCSTCPSRESRNRAEEFRYQRNRQVWVTIWLSHASRP